VHWFSSPLRQLGDVGNALPTKLDKLDAVLAQTSTSKQDAALFAEMLSLPNDGRYPALDLIPEQRTAWSEVVCYAVIRLTASRSMSVLSKGRLFGLTTFDWTVLLGSSSLCGLLTLLF
jgi:1,6-anhydro-N-acetylmuramate kinase